MPDYIPSQDANFNLWGINFANVCGTNAAALELSVGELTEIEDASANFTSDLNASETAKAAAKGAVAQKNFRRTDSESIYRKYAQQFLANPNLTELLLGELGLPTSPGSMGPVTIPTDLTATGYANGDNRLKWNRNGNAQGTTFLIEAMIGTSQSWQIVGTTTRRTYTHSDQIPGQQVVYRVYASRAGFTSSASNEASVYNDMGAEFLELSEAA